MSDYLLQEVIDEILFKLPLKDLVRCTVVCKAWNSLIKDPNFISTHIKKQRQKKKQSDGEDELLFIRLYDHFVRENYSLHRDDSTLDLYKNYSQLFSLNANSWKTITPSPPQYQIDPGKCHTFVNGAIHWIGWRQSDRRTVIVRFNVSDEVFDEIELPWSLVKSSCYSLDVKNYRESSIAVVEVDSRDDQLDIWIMTRYGMVDSWTKVFSRTIECSKVLWFRKEEEVLLQWPEIPPSACASLVSLNMKEVRMKMLNHPKEELDYLAHGYVETLVLIDKGKPATPTMLELASLDNDDDSL